MSPSTPGPATRLAVRLELHENRLPQAFLPGNLLDIQHGSYREAEVVHAMGGEGEAEMAVDGDRVAQLEIDGPGKTGGARGRDPAFPSHVVNWPMTPSQVDSGRSKKGRKCLIIGRSPDNVVDGLIYDVRTSGDGIRHDQRVGVSELCLCRMGTGVCPVTLARAGWVAVSGMEGKEKKDDAERIL